MSSIRRSFGPGTITVTIVTTPSPGHGIADGRFLGLFRSDSLDFCLGFHLGSDLLPDYFLRRGNTGSRVAEIGTSRPSASGGHFYFARETRSLFLASASTRHGWGYWHSDHRGRVASLDDGSSVGSEGNEESWV
jgi:hypothetical protein